MTMVGVDNSSPQLKSVGLVLHDYKSNKLETYKWN